MSGTDNVLTKVNYQVKTSFDLAERQFSQVIKTEKGRRHPLPVSLDSEFDIKLRVDDLDSIKEI